MFVDEISMKDFRNYAQGGISFSKGVNIIYGANAMGKTNILEAIFLICYARSHRYARENEMIRHGSSQASIRAKFNSHGRSFEGEIKLFPNEKKQIKMNGISIKKTSDLMGYLNAVMFCPEDLRIIKGAPRERRRVMDFGICQISKKYFYSLSQYIKVIEQRNKLLKENPTDDSLWVWNEKLLKHGSDIICMRKSFLDLIKNHAASVQKEMSGENLDIIYKSSVDIKDFSSAEAINEQFERELKRNIEREKAFGTSLVGPHRDDFEVFINEKEAKIYGSQGQQRTAALALKIGQLLLIKEKTSQPPILLLDDVFSELDETRQSYLIDKISGMQVIITCTALPKHSKGKKIKIEDVGGNVSALGG
ncbi:MAG: DNA replication/repair protein RecF [Firmicutes bacterium]|nr:DNA replication/repair protein RecF [Bacillota bacterium]